jgi:hypothetical protein
MAIACHPEVIRQFSGGIYFMRVGKDATPDYVVALLTDIVKESGGTRLAADVSACSTVLEAAAKTASWFAREDKRCLLVCDDLWETNVRKTGFFPDFVRLVDKPETATSCHRLLFSSRNHDIGRFSQACRVYFSPLDSHGTEAIVMLCVHCRSAKFPPRGIAAREDFDVVLGRCAGLPLALAVAGRAIAEHVDMGQGSTAGKALRLFSRRLQNSSSNQILLEDGLDGLCPSLKKSLGTSLKSACTDTVPEGCSLSVQEMYMALRFTTKREETSLETWIQLCNLEATAGCYATAVHLASRSLLVLVGVQDKTFIELHSLLHDFCTAFGDQWQ